MKIFLSFILICVSGMVYCSFDDDHRKQPLESYHDVNVSNGFDVTVYRKDGTSRAWKTMFLPTFTDQGMVIIPAACERELLILGVREEDVVFKRRPNAKLNVGDQIAAKRNEE